MKKLLLGSGFLLTILILSACEVTVAIENNPNRLIVTEAVFYTNYRYEGQTVVCNDRTTNFGYEISYRGEIESIDASLTGNRSGRSHSIRTTTPNRSENEKGFLSRSFSVRREIAPTALISEELEVQAIVVRPRRPQIIGNTVLTLNVYSRKGGEALGFRSQPIPVLDHCE